MISSSSHVLYLGDDELTGAASYLAAVLTHASIRFRHVPSSSPLLHAVESDVIQGACAIVLSDYPNNRLTDTGAKELQAAVRDGAGLLMIGGWESFGCGGYADTAIEALLPVAIQPEDDRVNWSYPCVASKSASHPIVDDLPFEHPPVIGGFNRVVAKPGSTTVLEARRYMPTQTDTIAVDEVGEPDPLLVVGTTGGGRCAALMTDVAPHWVGGLVDWGDERVQATIAGSVVEVGNWYARLVRNIVLWTSGSEVEETGERHGH